MLVKVIEAIMITLRWGVKKFTAWQNSLFLWLRRSW